MGNVIFVTGTDTGAGKTLLTALLLVHLRKNGCHALATKPFCSGGRTDIEILARAQENQLPLNRITPYYSPEPAAPLVAARKRRQRIPFGRVIEHIRTLAAECEILLVEGAGGLLVPLGDHYTVADVIDSLRCPVLVAARNKLGAVNHSLLTLAALRPLSVPGATVVLMNTASGSLATRSNALLIGQWSSPERVVELPYLGSRPEAFNNLLTNEKKIKKTLARILRMDIFSSAFRR
jgi:dethiobiotin synthetase